MAKIILNNEEFNFDGYTRNTFFGADAANEESLTSNAYITGLKGENLITRLNALSYTPITSLQIVVGREVIYALSDITARFTSMDESFNGNDAMNVNLNIKFN